MLEQYHQQLCQEWGHTPTQSVSHGYESVESDLRQFSKQVWLASDDAGREAIEQAVFDIYREVAVLPITYYSLDGCRRTVLDVAGKNKNVENNRLAVGNSAGQALCRFWFPNMQDAKWNTNDTVSLRSRFNHDAKLRRAIGLCYRHRDEGDEAVMPQSLRRALELVNGGTIQNFKPMNARAVWEYLCPMIFGRVLDFSSGYGGRMLGAMTSNFRYHYTGIDPNTRTHQGLEAMGELIREQGLSSGFEMHNLPSEEFAPEAGSYDVAFSSPPYFNLETYCDEPTQCMNRYRNLDRWFDGYVAPTLSMIHRALTSDGVYAVNIADYRNGKESFTIVDRWRELSEKLGFEYVETIEMMLNTRPGVGNNKLERAYKSEGIYVFRKKIQ